jgi:hypothetical protein
LKDKSVEVEKEKVVTNKLIKVVTEKSTIAGKESAIAKE